MTTAKVSVWRAARGARGPSAELSLRSALRMNRRSQTCMLAATPHNVGGQGYTPPVATDPESHSPTKSADRSEEAAAGRDWTRIGLYLVLATAGYNIVEAALALWFGVEAESIALVGFGLDSIIECAAAGALVFRLSLDARGAEPSKVERAEELVQRFVGITFLALALYVTVQAGQLLVRREAPTPSTLGIVLAAASLVVMPTVAWGKFRAAKEIPSAALRAEAKETLACSYLSFTLLVGLAANAWAGLWWADPVAALVMVPWLAKEGLENLRGEEEDAEH